MNHPRPILRLDDDSMPVVEYVCGLLKPEEHAQAHVLLSRDDQALALALAWEDALLALVDALPRVQPSSALRERLQRTLDIDPPPAFLPPAQLLRRPSVEPVAAAMPPAPPPASSVTAQRAQAPASPQPLPEASATPVAAPPPPTVAVTPPRPEPLRQTAEKPRPTASKPPPPPVAPPPRPTPLETGQPSPTPAASQADTTRKNPGNEDGARRHRRLVRKLWFWRLVGVCGASAAIAGFMLPGEPPPPPVQIIKVAPTHAAILQAPGSTSTPGWTATLGPEGNLMMRPLVRTEVPAGSQALLWTRSPRIPEPRLLGRIDPNQPIQVPAARLGALADDQLLEITLETDADAARALPNGPVLFIGQMTVFGSEGAAATASGGAATASSPTGGLITR